MKLRDRLTRQVIWLFIRKFIWLFLLPFIRYYYWCRVFDKMMCLRCKLLFAVSILCKIPVISVSMINASGFYPLLFIERKSSREREERIAIRACQPLNVRIPKAVSTVTGRCHDQEEKKLNGPQREQMTWREEKIAKYENKNQQICIYILT